MKFLLAAAATAALIALSTGNAHAIPIPAGWVAAAEIIDFDQGKRKDGSNVLAERSDPSKALGAVNAPCADGPGCSNFVSLGFGGSIVLGFGGALFKNDVAIVWETSFGNPSTASYPERADIYVIDLQGNEYQVADNIGQGEVAPDAAIDLSGIAALDGKLFKWIKIVDASSMSRFGNDADGFDVNAVGVIAVQVPEPMTLALLGAGLAGIGVARRRA